MAFAQQPGAALHPPVGEVLHRRHAGQDDEPFVQRRARKTDPTPEVFHGPGVRRTLVHQRDRPAYLAVAQCPEPAGGFGGEPVQVTPGAVDEHWIQHHPAWNIPASVGHWFGLAGPNVIIPNACAAGNFSIGYATDLIRSGRADAMLAGGADPFSRVAFTGFARLGSVAPEQCQPFDRHRRGILVGEGAGILLLERKSFAVARGAVIYAEVLGYGLSSDAHHMTTPDETGAGIARAMREALHDAGLATGDVDYISAHGTGTPINDVVETRAVKQVFGARAEQVPMSSIKSMLGHTMGAASAIEAIACALTVKEGVVPPTMNYQTPDPECDLDYVPNARRDVRPSVALNNALAFGGVNSCVAFGEAGCQP